MLDSTRFIDGLGYTLHLRPWDCIAYRLLASIRVSIVVQQSSPFTKPPGDSGLGEFLNGLLCRSRPFGDEYVTGSELGVVVGDQ